MLPDNREYFSIQSKIGKRMPETLTGKLFAFILATLFLIGMAFFLIPYLVTHQSWLWSYDDKTGSIGDTIGGITGPIIGLVGVILTFFAFYIQFKANQIQILAFSDQKSSTERQEKQIQTQQFENNYFELIKLHRENVSEFDYRDTRGRAAVVKIIDEIAQLFESIKDSNFYFDHELSDRDVINIAYLVSYYGTTETVSEELKNRLHFRYGDAASDILEWIEKEIKKGIVLYNKSVLKYNGQQSRLGHYFRHMFRTVKFVHNNPALTDQTKKEYVKILRAQLSTHEQILLFFNCVSDLGAPWDLESDVKEENKLITNYEMIKNIPLGTVYGFNPKEFFPGIKFEAEFKGT